MFPQAMAPKAKPVNALLIVAIVVVIVIAVILAVVFLAFSGSKATLNIRVYSTHLLSTITYTLYVDGSSVDTDTLSPGYYMTYEYEHSWMSSGSTSVIVSATSTGGTFGPVSDTEILTVEDGESYTINLYV